MTNLKNNLSEITIDDSKDVFTNVPRQSKNLKYGININELDTEEYVSSPKPKTTNGVSHTVTNNLMPTFDADKNNDILSSINLSKKTDSKLYFKISTQQDIEKLNILDFSLLTLFGSLWEKYPHKKTYTLQEIAKELINTNEAVEIRSEELNREIIQSCRRLNLSECYLNFEEDARTVKRIEREGKAITEFRGSLYPNNIVGVRLKNGEKIFGVSLLDKSKFYTYLTYAGAIRSYPKKLFELSSKNNITLDFINIYLFLKFRVINFISYIESGRLEDTSFKISVNELYGLIETEKDKKLTRAEKQRARKKTENILDDWTDNGLIVKWETLKKGQSINQYKIYMDNKKDFKELKKNAQRLEEVDSIKK
jgi:hypothetical protein